MKPLLVLLGAAFVLGVTIYGRNRRPFLIFQAVMLPVFLWFFHAEVMQIIGVPGSGEGTSGVWFLPFVLVWIVGTAALGLWSLRHFAKGEPT